MAKIKKIEEKIKNRSEYRINDERSKVNLDAQMIKTPMLRNSFVSMLDTFNIQKERIAKRFIINSFILSSFVTLLAKTFFVNFA